MEKTISVGNRQIRIRATIGAMLMYKQQFGNEYYDDCKVLRENETTNTAAQLMPSIIKVGFQLIWSMAKAADDNIPPPDDFIKEFDGQDIYNAMSAAQQLYTDSLKSAKSEDKKETQSESKEKLTTEKLVAYALAFGLSIKDIESLSVGMLMNILSECSDIKGGGESDVKIATQSDFDNF